MYVLRSCMIAWKWAQTNITCDRISGPEANQFWFQDSRVLSKFFFTPGGASYVTFNEVSRMIGGNLAWGSVVSQQRKLLWGARLLISFSSNGTQLMTKCKFFRHTQSPTLAASRRSLMASSFCPPPMAN